MLKFLINGENLGHEAHGVRNNENTNEVHKFAKILRGFEFLMFNRNQELRF